MRKPFTYEDNGVALKAKWPRSVLYYVALLLLFAIVADYAFAWGINDGYYLGMSDAACPRQIGV